MARKEPGELVHPDSALAPTTSRVAGFVQFTLYGVLLGFIDARQRESPSAAAA